MKLLSKMFSVTEIPVESIYLRLRYKTLSHNHTQRNTGALASGGVEAAHIFAQVIYKNIKQKTKIKKPLDFSYFM